MFDQFTEWEHNRHDYARAWKERTGGKVLGYFCTYVPEEIPYAAGVLPVRILGSHEPQDVTEPHIFGMFCPFCRDCLAQGLKGRYDYLDGIMIAQSCLHIRQTLQQLAEARARPSTPTTFPCRTGSRAHAPTPTWPASWRRSSARSRSGPAPTIDDEDLKRSIEVYNTSRRLLREVYELRKGPSPALTGEEAMEMVMSNQMVDKAEHNQALAEVLDNLPQRTIDRSGDIRLMLVGSEDDDIPFIHLVESLGAVVVTDEHCTGTRYFWNEVELDGDILLSLARRYIDRPACPSKDWPEIANPYPARPRARSGLRRQGGHPHPAEVLRPARARHPGAQEGARGRRHPDPDSRVRRHGAPRAVPHPGRGVPGDVGARKSSSTTICFRSLVMTQAKYPTEVARLLAQGQRAAHDLLRGVRQRPRTRGAALGRRCVERSARCRRASGAMCAV